MILTLTQESSLIRSILASRNHLIWHLEHWNILKLKGDFQVKMNTELGGPYLPGGSRISRRGGSTSLEGADYRGSYVFKILYERIWTLGGACPAPMPPLTVKISKQFSTSISCEPNKMTGWKGTKTELNTFGTL